VPDVVVGHSLGELGAAVLALGLDDDAAITLAATRGRLMAEAALAAPGGMCAIRGAAAELDQALRLAETEGCVLAAENTPDERVVSGPEAALVRVLARLGARASRLRTVGPWHSPAMAPAVAPFRARLLDALGDRPLRVPFRSAVGPSSPPDAFAVADALARGLVEPVHFAAALAGITRVRALAPSRTLRSLVRRAQPGIAVDGEA
jgi:acyl transferase domain-containing protein